MLFVYGLFLMTCLSLVASDKEATSTASPAAFTTIAGKLTPSTASDSAPSGHAQNASFMPALEMYLFDRDGDTFYYDSSIRPNQFSTLVITAEFLLAGVYKVDENKGLIGVSGVMYLNWEDSRLTWNATDFGNIKGVMFDGYRIWMPQFTHNGMKMIDYRNQVSKAYVTSSGKIDAIISVNEEVPCRFDMTDFPRDTQSCDLQFYHIDLPVTLKPTPSGMLDGDGLLRTELDKSFPQHTAWNVLNVSMSAFSFNSGTVNEEGDVLITTITMKRHSVFFVRAYVTPVCFLLLLTPVIFLLPPDSSEKLTYGAVLLFSMIYVSQNVESLYPPYTDTTPYLIKLTTASGALLFICLFLTSVISSVERVGRKRALPVWIKRYIVGVVGRYLLVKENDDGLTHGTVHIKPSREGDRDFIVQNEQSVDLSDECNEGLDASRGSSLSDGTQALRALVNELRQSRLQSRTQDDWTNLFTIVNRFLFLLTLFISIIILLCFA